MRCLSALATLPLALALCPPLLAAIPSPSPKTQTWESSVSPFAPADFPKLRSATVEYNFGWNGLTAAGGKIQFTRTANNQLKFDITGGTVGLVERLWDYDVQHTALSDAQTLRPISVKEVEEIRSKRFETKLTYTPAGVTSEREERKGDSVKSKTRTFQFSNVLSLNSALLLMRTQPLPDGAKYRIVVYPATSAYLCTITVLGRDRVTVPTGAYDAIKLELKLKKIGKKRELRPHKKFRNATVWLSDDPDRIPLRIEAKVFIGTVFAELQSVEFENPKP